MRNRDNILALVRTLGIPLVGEGLMMILCLVPMFLGRDSESIGLLPSALFTLFCGLLILLSIPKSRKQPDRRVSYLMVTLIWLVLSLFGTLPFLATGTVLTFTDAYFEAMSGLTSTGATIMTDVENLPYCILLWRSVSQWIGGFGIILLVLAVVPTLGINKHSLYTAEASGADNTGKIVASTSVTVRRTLLVYLVLTTLSIIALVVDGLPLWPAVNLAFSNISSGGFSIYGDGISSLTPSQQYILAGVMFLSGINFMLLYHLSTFKFSKVKRKFEQFGFYLAMTLCSVAFVAVALHVSMGHPWHDAVRMSTVQTISVITTTGSVVADTSQWWVPITFLFLALSLCGGMAGSTTGGLKVMRILILIRNVRTKLRNRLHPNVINPVRLNGKPVSPQIVENVMVIFFVFVFSVLLGVFSLMLCGESATEAIGAVVACITGYGPGLGPSGGFGSYMAFAPAAKWILMFLMLLGRLECLTVFILFVPSFWRR